MNRLCTVLACTVSVVSVSAISVAGETTKNDSAMELARQEQNPLARFIRLQVEDNVQFGFGPDNDALNFLRLQPTMPFDLSGNLDLITGAIIPIVHQALARIHGRTE